MREEMAAGTSTRRPGWDGLREEIARRFGSGARVDRSSDGRKYVVECRDGEWKAIAGWLHGELGFGFATFVTEETGAGWKLQYVFYEPEGSGWVYLNLSLAGEAGPAPSLSDIVYAADWEEREAEDLFGLHFEGHPKLGEFVLHEHWPEGVNPMRRSFEVQQKAPATGVPPLFPARILETPGALALPIGPVFSDFAESANFLLETTGEEVIRVASRFFYKYRAVEKIAEGKAPRDVLLLAERFSGTSAFAHGLAFCQAVEEIAETAAPARAAHLRSLFAELERARHHTAHIAGICGSTGLDVAQAQAAILEEELLRVSGKVSGHRYLFGLLTPGGLTLEPGPGALEEIAAVASGAARRLEELERMLRFSSSFLDRLEEVGTIPPETAREFGLVGPVARASGGEWDVRRAFPYAGYGRFPVRVAREEEGDGYARLRVLFREAAESLRVVGELAVSAPKGEIQAAIELGAGAALGAVEAPIGSTFHWVRLDERGAVVRYRIETPSFRNWHAFRQAVEGFGFQDFPIILATFGLSCAECDR
jgi:formate hydrogenlyase subunit 5